MTMHLFCQSYFFLSKWTVSFRNHLQNECPAPRTHVLFFLKLIKQKGSPTLECKRSNLFIRSLTPHRLSWWTWGSEKESKQELKPKRHDLETRREGLPPTLNTAHQVQVGLIHPPETTEGWFSPVSGYCAARCPGAPGLSAKRLERWRGAQGWFPSPLCFFWSFHIFSNGCIVLLSLKREKQKNNKAKEKHSLIFHHLTCAWRKRHRLKKKKSTTQWLLALTRPHHQQQITEQNGAHHPETPLPGSPPPSDHHLSSHSMHSCSQVGDLRPVELQTSLFSQCFILCVKVNFFYCGKIHIT